MPPQLNIGGSLKHVEQVSEKKIRLGLVETLDTDSHTLIDPQSFPASDRVGSDQGMDSSDKSLVGFGIILVLVLVGRSVDPVQAIDNFLEGWRELVVCCVT